jgi:hypothetical protein
MWLEDRSGDGFSSDILAYMKTASELREVYKHFREEVTKLSLREFYYISISMSHILSAYGIMHIQIYTVTKVIDTYIYYINNI